MWRQRGARGGQKDSPGKAAKLGLWGSPMQVAIPRRRTHPSNARADHSSVVERQQPATSQEDAKKKRADVAREGFEKALANMRELAEITTQSQKQAFDVVRKRIEENVEDIRNLGKKAGK